MSDCQTQVLVLALELLPGISLGSKLAVASENKMGKQKPNFSTVSTLKVTYFTQLLSLNHQQQASLTMCVQTQIYSNFWILVNQGLSVKNMFQLQIKSIIHSLDTSAYMSMWLYMLAICNYLIILWNQSAYHREVLRKAV